MTAIRRLLPSGALLLAEIVDDQRAPIWLAAILDRYPDSPEPTRYSVQLLNAPVLQAVESYVLTRWVDFEDIQRVVTKPTAAHADPVEILTAHNQDVALLMRKHPVHPGSVE